MTHTEKIVIDPDTYEDENMIIRSVASSTGSGSRSFVSWDNDVSIKSDFTKSDYDYFRTPGTLNSCLLYTSPSPRDRTRSRMPSSA